MGCQPVWFVILHAVRYSIGVKQYRNRYILTCGSICDVTSSQTFCGAVRYADDIEW